MNKLQHTEVNIYEIKREKGIKVGLQFLDGLSVQSLVHNGRLLRGDLGAHVDCGLRVLAINTAEYQLQVSSPPALSCSLLPRPAPCPPPPC